jgi:hypothetical protein
LQYTKALIDNIDISAFGLMASMLLTALRRFSVGLELAITMVLIQQFLKT